ncbi:MAG: hypothetical protein DRQ48_09120 [Gammaproteobacteria bacterium]|nr:MAG: hypothetical protein DRQ48_09120 [Gammaproteobacteria bacterium]
MIKNAIIKSAVMSYVEKLPDELKKRYGGSGEYGYTEPQVRKTIDDLKLNKKHIQYAILIFCGESVLRDQGVDSESILDITNFLRKYPLEEEWVMLPMEAGVRFVMPFQVQTGAEVIVVVNNNYV